MKTLITFAALFATPALAHEGHAELAGPNGHALAHGLLAAGAAAALWGAVKLWQSTRKEE